MLKAYGLVGDLIEEGYRDGELAASRTILLEVLAKRFGELPEAVEVKVRNLDVNAAQALLLRVLDAASLAELGLVT